MYILSKTLKYTYLQSGFDGAGYVLFDQTSRIYIPKAFEIIRKVCIFRTFELKNTYLRMKKKEKSMYIREEFPIYTYSEL